MSDNTQNSKRIAKNTIFLYIRMGLLMLISLYTSRVVVQQLGVEDFGIFSLIGSIIALFSSLKTLFISSTQRFLNYEIGRQNIDRLSEIFTISLIINAFISILFVICVECVGVWFINNKMNVDPTRINAALWVLHFSTLTSVVSIIMTSFEALIVAHERFNFYAIISVIEGCLRLLVALALAYTKNDKLIVYSALLLGVHIIIISINIIYCNKAFPQIKISKHINHAYLIEMSKFAGWNFFGNLSFSLIHSGMNMVLNMFGGVLTNAARGIAYQVKSAMEQVLNNTVMAVTPRFIQLHAADEKDRMFLLMFFSSKIYFSIQLIILIPLTYMTREIITLWLGLVPDFTIIFTQLVLANLLLRALHAPIDTLFKAYGKLRTYQITECLIQSSSLVLTYLSLSAGWHPASAFVWLILIEFINLCAILFIASKQTELQILSYIKKVAIPCFVCTIFAGILFYFASISEKSWQHLCYSLVAFVVCTCYMFFIGFTHKEQDLTKNLIGHFLLKSKN